MGRLFDDAASQYLNYAGAILTAPPMTASAWVYNDACDSNDQIFNISASNWNDFYFLELRDTSGIFWFAGSAAASGSAMTTTGTSINTWHHAAGIEYSSSSRAAFIDGGSKGTDNTNVTPSGLNNTDIGRWFTGGTQRPWSGMLAEACLWNVPLIDLEIWQLWMGRPPWEIRPANLVGLWLPFGDWTDRDYSGRGHHMTAYNGPTFSGFDPPKTVRAWRSNSQYIGRRVVGREQPGGVWARPAGGLPRIPRHPAAYFDGPTIF